RDVQFRDPELLMLTYSLILYINCLTLTYLMIPGPKWMVLYRQNAIPFSTGQLNKVFASQPNPGILPLLPHAPPFAYYSGRFRIFCCNKANIQISDYLF